VNTTSHRGEDMDEPIEPGTQVGLSVFADAVATPPPAPADDPGGDGDG
jgi:hypothetical protein